MAPAITGIQEGHKCSYTSLTLLYSYLIVATYL